MGMWAPTPLGKGDAGAINACVDDAHLDTSLLNLKRDDANGDAFAGAQTIEMVSAQGVRQGIADGNKVFVLKSSKETDGAEEFRFNISEMIKARAANPWGDKGTADTMANVFKKLTDSGIALDLAAFEACMSKMQTRLRWESIRGVW